MFTKGKTFLFLFILAGITAAATLRLTLHSAVDPVPEKGARFIGSASKYSSDSNKQLQSTSLGLVKKIRGLTDSYNKNDRDLIAEYQTNYSYQDHRTAIDHRRMEEKIGRGVRFHCT
jgi:hypothetical protein